MAAAGEEGLDYSVHEAWNEATNVYLLAVLASLALLVYARRRDHRAVAEGVEGTFVETVLEGEHKPQLKDKAVTYEDITPGRRGSDQSPKMELMMEMISTMQKDVKSNFGEVKQEILQVEKLEEIILATRQDLSDMKEEMITMEEKLDYKDKQIASLEEKLVIIELRSKTKNTWLRGLKEINNESLDKRIIPEIVNFIEY
uniref:Uncharacterized protein n=1 Tax=Sphaerodactylus townsendi TaxID=933632 RepID=A0ACB8FTH3_9SAUR